ncbi:MAG: recombinase family protein [Oscillospiraceae bacterium]
MAQKAKVWTAALYCRLSREDGDRAESDSIGNQRKLLREYIAAHPELTVGDEYVDDGYTGVNFHRPAFQQMLLDIERGTINCILVKDLSRFGRDYIEAGRYLEHWLPEHGARFIAISDNIDSDRGAYDMMMPLKNLFNTQYARDISQKVKSALHAKQQRGEFIGAFAGYGYLKDPENHNRLIVDPVAAAVVSRIFSLFENGAGKIKIAKLLNAEQIPCPSEYKRLMGEKYRNCNKLDATTYWTYATIHRLLQSEVYIGSMEQGRDVRANLHGSAKRKERADWIVVPDTHEAIIPREQWDRVQALMERKTHTPDFQSNVSPFAGYLKCGDCGRSMVKTTWGGAVFYTCGSYKRYGSTVCSKHYIPQKALEELVLGDLNRIIESVHNLQTLAESGASKSAPSNRGQQERLRLEGALERVSRLKQGAYEDWKERLISKPDFLRYQEDYGRQEGILQGQLDRLAETEGEGAPLDKPWVQSLLKLGKLTELDRLTIAETISTIRIFEEGNVEITYRFSEELGTLLEGGRGEASGI